MARPPEELFIATVILEYIVLALFVAGTVAYQVVLWRRRVFHRNLYFLLAIDPVAQYIYFVPFHFRAIYKMFGTLPNGPKRVLWFFEDIAIIGSTFNMVTLAIERAVATVLVNSYENFGRRIPFLSIIVATVIQWVVACFMILKIYDGTWSVVTCLIVMAVLSAVAAVVFALLPFISKYVHKRNMNEEIRFAQGVNRYQSVENVRSAKVLNRYALFQVVFVGFSLVILYIFKEQSGDYYSYVEIVFNAYYAGGGLLAEALVCFSHPVLRKETVALLSVFAKFLVRRHRISAKANTQSTVKSIQGQELNINSEQHSSVYFTLYEDAWRRNGDG